MEKAHSPVPSCPEAELGYLACAMLDQNHIGDIEPRLFYDNRHKMVAEVMLRLYSAGKPVSEQTLSHELKSDGKLDWVGGLQFLSGLADHAATSTEFGHWKRILVESFILRRIVQSASEAILLVGKNGKTSDEILDVFERDVLSIRQLEGKEHTAPELIDWVTGYLDACFRNKGSPRGIMTGYYDFDHMTNGLADGELVVIGARPSMGKTSLALNMAEHIAVDGKKPVGIFSLEMTARSLMLRMACSRARVDLKAAERGDLDPPQFRKLSIAALQIRRATIIVDDVSRLTIGQLSARARRMKHRHGIRVLFVDYVQLLRAMERRSENRNAEMTEVCNGLQQLSKELMVPIIACSQLNRAVDRDDRTPRLSDLRESGAIEQASDIVILLHNPKEMTGDSWTIEAKIAKHRNGPTGGFKLTFFKLFTRFESQEPEPVIAENDVPKRKKQIDTTLPYKD